MNKELERKWILSESAWFAIKQKMPIGTLIEGYTPERKEALTTGEEGSTGKYEGFCERQVLETNTDLIWRYGGISENGKLVIVSDIPKQPHSKSKIMLANSGGYIKGPAVLDKICRELYSVESLGIARNMNITDVNRILDYTGPRGKYWDFEGNGIETQNAKNIGDLASELGRGTTFIKTPDGRNVDGCKSDYYCIPEETHHITNEELLRKMVYPTDLQEYWLASTCINACFDYSMVGFSVRYVKAACVNAHYMYLSDGDRYRYTSCIRPVAELESRIKIEYDNEKNICKIA